LDSSIFEELARTPSGIAGEIQLTDAIKNTIANTPSYGYRFQGKRFDCGNQLGFLQANIEFALRDPHFGEQAKEYIKKLAGEIK
jgi:UTP--glucose-1-phosphate uridylyltransferase